MCGWADLLCLNYPPTSLYEVWRDFFCLQQLLIHIPYRGWADSLQKNLAVAWRLSALQVEVKSLYNRNKLSLNCKGMTVFAVAR